MNNKIILPLLAAMLLSGCTHHYVITTTSGTRIDTSTKPRMKNGFYVFKDALGREQAFSAGRVSEVSPASMATKEKDGFLYTPSK
jgi:hypothetical protein